MGVAHIPVNLFNPGQVFACLGFMEAAEALLGDAEGRFEWQDETAVRFRLHAAGESNPVEVVLDFLARVSIIRIEPTGYSGVNRDDPSADAEEVHAEPSEAAGCVVENVFPASVGDRMSLPIRLVDAGGGHLSVSHWADGSSRESFKLYSGNRSAERIALAMLAGTRQKPKKRQSLGDLLTKGISQLADERRSDLLDRPFDLLTPMGGSFNLDPRGGWTAMDAGYSPNDQDHGVQSSPVVEMLAAIGLEHARPDEFDKRKVRYSAWGVSLPLMLARVALQETLPGVWARRFRFDLALSGKNKVATFASEE